MADAEKTASEPRGSTAASIRVDDDVEREEEDHTDLDALEGEIDEPEDTESGAG